MYIRLIHLRGDFVNLTVVALFTARDIGRVEAEEGKKRKWREKSRYRKELEKENRGKEVEIEKNSKRKWLKKKKKR